MVCIVPCHIELLLLDYNTVTIQYMTMLAVSIPLLHRNYGVQSNLFELVLDMQLWLALFRAWSSRLSSTYLMLFRSNFGLHVIVRCDFATAGSTNT